MKVSRRLKLRRRTNTGPFGERGTRVPASRAYNQLKCLSERCPGGESSDEMTKRVDKVIEAVSACAGILKDFVSSICDRSKKSTGNTSRTEPDGEMS